jgi:hypothetical protein
MDIVNSIATLLAAALITPCVFGNSGVAQLQQRINEGAASVVFPSGTLELEAPIYISRRVGSTQLLAAPGGTTLLPGPKFRGKALIIAEEVNGLAISGLRFEGRRNDRGPRKGLPKAEVTFTDHMEGHGVLLLGCREAVLRNLKFAEMSGMAVLVRGGSRIRIEYAEVRDSGSLDARGRNNTSGGILFEDGVDDFTVRWSKFERIRGNALWTHSRYQRPRNSSGRFLNNQMKEIGRDALQAGHATRMRIEDNEMERIGYPVDIVDMEQGGIPVGIDTAGDVDRSLYAGNTMREINGKCIDLDGFHDGDVKSNVCRNTGKPEDYPLARFGLVFNNTNIDMRSKNVLVEGNEFDGLKYGGIFVIGEGHIIRRNKLRNLNQAGCNESHGRFACYWTMDEPDVMQTGIYLGKGAERDAAARGVKVLDNVISGHRMKERCIAASPKVDMAANTVERNVCLSVTNSQIR